MSSDRTITIAGQLVVLAGPRSVGLAPGTIFVEQGKIAHIRRGEILPEPDFGGENAVVFPGFVDTHVHLPQFDSIGQDGMELLDWLERVIFPAELRWADVDFATAACGRAVGELLACGTTSVAAYATSHHSSAQAAINCLAGAGMSGYVGQVLMDQHGHRDLLVPASAALSQASMLRGKGRVSPAVTPRFAVACSRGLLEGAGTLAKRTGWLVQTHLAETTRECRMVKDLHGADSYTELYRMAGLLGPRTILGHGIWLGDDEVDILSGSSSIIAHCPTANRFLDAGVMNRSRALTRGAGVCLGSDVGAGPDRSMVRVARSMIDAAKQVRGMGHAEASVPNAADAFYCITAGNAEAIGLSGTGVISPGCWGDLVVAEPPPTWQSALDPLSYLLYGWDDRWISATLATGRRVYAKGGSDLPVNSPSIT